MFAKIIVGIVVVLFLAAILILPMIQYGGFLKGLGYLALVCLVGLVFGIIWALHTLMLM